MNGPGSCTTARLTHLQNPPDLMAQAALVLYQDASTSRELARSLRRQAREDNLEQHQQVAEKLREMAQSALGSAIWQGAATLGSAACTLGAGLREISAADLERTANQAADQSIQKTQVLMDQSNQRAKTVMDPVQALSRQSKWLEASAKGLTAMSLTDPLGIHRQYQAVKKKEIENRAMQAEDRVKEQGDREAEAQRLENSSLNLLQKLLDARHQAMMAAARE